MVKAGDYHLVRQQKIGHRIAGVGVVEQVGRWPLLTLGEVWSAHLHNVPEEPNPESIAILRETAPLNHVKPGLPPFLLLHGDADKTVPYPTSVNFQARLRAAGVPCELITIPGAPHGLLTWDKFLPGYQDQMIAWLRANLK